MIIEEQALRSKTDTENKTPSIRVTKTLIAKTNQNVNEGTETRKEEHEARTLKRIREVKRQWT